MKEQNIIKKKPPTLTPQKVLKKPSRIKTVSAVMLLAVGLAIMPAGFVLSNYIQGEIDEGVKAQVEVPHPHNEGFEEWESNDYDDAPKMYRNFYMWNLTNPDGFLAGQKPIYEEIGPFTFREYNYKYDIDFSKDKDSVEFKQYSKYIQIAGDNISDIEITNINPGFLGSIEFAGGTDLHYNKLNFPFVLSQLKDQFDELYSATVDEKLSDDDFIRASVNEMLKDSTATLWILFIPTALNVTNEFINCVGLDAIKEFMRDGLPTSEEVFYEEWANDYFPAFVGNYTILYDAAQGINAPLLRQVINDHKAQDAQDTIITMQNARLIDQSGSLNKFGIDIEYNLYGETVGSESDLNISNAIALEVDRFIDTYTYLLPPAAGAETTMDLPIYERSGGSGLTYDQCVALWNNSNPNSLTGMDYEVNKVWFEAAENDPDAIEFLTTTFDITEVQLFSILKWINNSIKTWVPNAIEYTINSWNSGVITRRTVEEWLFNAEDTAIHNFMSYYRKDNSKWEVNIIDNCHDELEAEKAGTPKCKIKTGRDDISKVGQFIEYDGHDTITLWEEPEEIEGTNGMQFAPSVTSEDDLNTFQPDLMRVVDLEFKKETEIYNIDLLRFKMSDETFEPNPNYYMNIQGLINLQPLEKYEGVEVRVSKPHMIDVDSNIRETIIGMKPNSDNYETYIDVEPITGLTMNARSCMQVNFELDTTEYYMKKINFTITPILWFEQEGEITEELAEKFKDMLEEALNLRDNLPLWGLGIGACLAVPGALLNTKQTIKRRKVKKLENANIINKIKKKPKGAIFKEKISNIERIGIDKQNPIDSSKKFDGGDVLNSELENAQPENIDTNGFSKND